MHEGDQALLDAVVEVAPDLAARLVGGVDDLQARVVGGGFDPGKAKEAKLTLAST
jgi:hypothetical protein